MAVYDCKYMIPYLDSLYSMELQYEKIIEEREKASEQYQKDYNIFNDIPDKPKHYKNRLYYQTYKGIILFIVSLFIRVILNWLRGIAVNHGMWDNLLCSGILSLLWLFSWLLTIGGILFFLLEILASSGSYKAAMQTYEQALALRERSITRSKTYRDIVEKDDKKLKEIQTRLEDMEKLRDRLYQINVIPVMYRNSQSIHFMKNFFRKHGNTDLDEAVRQMLIQKAIKNTDELEYDAERSVSNQEKQNMLQDQIQREHSDLMEGVDMELDSIEASQERQEKYLKMMESTSLMAAFFAAE